MHLGLIPKCKPLKEENAKLRELVQDLEARISTSQAECEERICQREKVVAESMAGILKDNNELRRYIETRKVPSRPNHLDDYYIQQFDDLDHTIQSWAHKHSKQNSNVTLTSAEQIKILEQIAVFGPMGKKSAELLRPQFLTLYTKLKTCRTLVRHIFAVFLFDQIFDPFALGLDNQVSNHLVFIEDNLFNQGNPITHKFLQ